jgi:O-antigen ligase
MVILAACPLISTSRGGIAVGFFQLIACFLMSAFLFRNISRPFKIGILSLLIVVLQVGLFLGWNRLVARADDFKDMNLSGRSEIYIAAKQMAEDYPLFGTGPGTFAVFHHIYRNESNDRWQAYVHNDWLETRLTFGWVGFGLIMALLLCALSHWFIGRGIPAPTVLVNTIYIALGGFFVHAIYDFPLQVYSILAVVILYLAILSSVSRKMNVS